MDLTDLPLLDVGGVGIGQPKQALGKVPHDRVLVQKLLIVEALGKHPFAGGRADDGALVGKHQLLSLDQRPCFL